MPNPKSQPKAPIEEVLAEIRQTLEEGQSRARFPSGTHRDAVVASSPLTPPSPCPDAKAMLQARGDARTLEDVVRDLLQPMLRSWFDENLRGVIEREMRAEIARVARETAA